MDWARRLLGVASNGASDEEVAQLALDYATSGLRLTFEGPTADIASTGGPSSLSTLIAPLFLVRVGMKVPTLAVPGRPAGGLDVLAQIPGYRVDLSPAEIYKIINHCGYAHFRSAGCFAPLDAKTFKLRQEHGIQAVPELVIASLLSKKIAVGVQSVGLDVRIAPHGNFGSDYETGYHNARRFVEVAKILKQTAVCILTDACLPFQPFIGRGEALWALQRIFDGMSDPWLNNHVNQCEAMVRALIGQTSEDNNFLVNPFMSNLIAQGGHPEGFYAKAAEIENGHQKFINSPLEGYPSYDLAAIRDIFLSVHELFKATKEFPDPIGIRLLARPDQMVTRGEPLMSVRLEAGVDRNVIDLLAKAVFVVNEPVTSIGDLCVQ